MNTDIMAGSAVVMVFIALFISGVGLGSGNEKVERFGQIAVVGLVIVGLILMITAFVIDYERIFRGF